MLEFFNKKIIQHCVKADIMSFFAVSLNCTLILLYWHEYVMVPINGVLAIVSLIYCICLTGVVLYLKNLSFNNKYFSILWISAIFLGLGFLPVYITLVTDGKKYLLLNLLSSLLILAIIVDWVFFVIISIIGIISAYALCLIQYSYIDLAIIHPSKKMYFTIYLMSYTFLVMTLFTRKKEKLQTKNMDFMKVFGGAIAHEVNTPLAAVKMASNVLDSIISTMDVKVENDKYLIVLDKMDYEMLTHTINQGLKKSTTEALQIVEMLLSALRDRYTKNHVTCNVSEVVKEAIEMSQELNSSSKKIFLNIVNDFQIQCSKKLLKHAIYNLIKNSLKHGGADVQIQIEILNNLIIVEDNGVGIQPKMLQKIFNAFITNGNGTGIGLAFCKFVLDDINAQLSCQSAVGQYTKFIINFKN